MEVRGEPVEEERGSGEAQATILQRIAGVRAATYLPSDGHKAPTYTDLLMAGHE